MKKILTGVLVSLTIASSAFAVEKIGIVDLDMVIQKYPKTQTANESINKQKKDIQTYALEAKKSILNAKNIDKKDVEARYSKEINKRMAALDKSQDDQVKAIRNDVDTAIKAVGAKGGYTIILPSTATLYGGTDVSQEVIKVLNAGKK